MSSELKFGPDRGGWGQSEEVVPQADDAQLCVLGGRGWEGLALQV
jgi:hypothetical protein